MATAKKTSSDGGTIFKGSDGSLYFVRDEMLDALRVEGEGLERLDEQLKCAKGGAKDAGSIKPIGYVKGSLLRQDPRNTTARAKSARVTARASTIMCPWFC